MSSGCGREKGCIYVCLGRVACENSYGCLKLQMSASPRYIVCFFLYVCATALPFKTGVSLPPCFMPWYPNPVSLLLCFRLVIKTVRVTWTQIPWSDITTAELIIDLTNRRVASTAWILWTKGWVLSWVWTKRCPRASQDDAQFNIWIAAFWNFPLHLFRLQLAISYWIKKQNLR